jgi:hypothetical protein
MDFDAFHHWAMLRPLFVFLLAGPLLIVAVLVDRHLSRRAERKTRRSATPVDASAPRKEQTPTGESGQWSWIAERSGTRGRIALTAPVGTRSVPSRS